MGTRRPRGKVRLGMTAVASVALAVAAITIAGACKKQETQRAAASQDVKLNTATIPIEGMSCSACAARIKKALTSMEGVSKVEVNLVERNARVGFAPTKITLEKLVSAINSLGYRASEPTEVK